MPHYLGNPLYRYTPPPPNALNFNPYVSTGIEPVFDELGNQVYDKSARDVPKLNPWGLSAKSD